MNIEWDEVDEPECADIVRYEVHVECEDVINALWLEIDPDEAESGHFEITTLQPLFPGSPWGFDQECWVTVNAVDESCNESSADIHFETCEEPDL